MFKRQESKKKKENSKINSTQNQKKSSLSALSSCRVQSDVFFVCRLTRSGLTSIEVSAIKCTQVKLTRLYLLHVSIESHIPSSWKHSYLKRAAGSSVDRHRLVTGVLFVTDSTEVTVLTHIFRRASDHIKVLI